jgi:hypothetical protein
VEPGLGGADWNLEDGGCLFKREIVLVAKEKDGSAGGGDKVEQSQEGFVGQFAKVGVESGDRFWASGVEWLPAA